MHAWRRSGPARTAKLALRKGSDALARMARRWAGRPPAVLFEVTNEFGYAAQEPVARELLARGEIRVVMGLPGDADAPWTQGIRELAELGAEVIPGTRARHRRFDAIVVTDGPRVHSWRSHGRTMLHHGSSYVNVRDPWVYRLMAEGVVEFLLALHPGEVERAFAVVGPELEGRVRVVGQPKLDRLLAGPVPGDPDRFELLPDPSQRTVLICSHWTPTGLLRACGGEVLGHLRERRDLNVLLSGHAYLWDPDTDWSGAVDWREHFGWVADEPHMRFVDDTATLHRAMWASDLVVSDHSSVTLEYAILAKPMVVFRNPEHRFHAQWLDACLARTAQVFSNGGDFPSALQRALEGGAVEPGPRGELLARCFAHLGSAVPAAADAIIEIAGSGRLTPGPGDWEGVLPDPGVRASPD